MKRARRPASASSGAHAALGAAAALLVVLACAKHDAATAPGPPPPIDEAAPLDSAVAASGFNSEQLWPAGTMILSPPGPPGDLRAYTFQHVVHRMDKEAGWRFSEPGPDGRPLRASGGMCWYVKADFLLFVTNAAGVQVAVPKPFANEDLDREFVFRRARSSEPWQLDSLSIAFILSDDHTVCDLCFTDFVSLRLTAPGLDTSLSRAIRPLSRLPQLPLGASIHIEAKTQQLGDAVFVDNGGTWSQLASTGPRAFAGDVMPRAGFTPLAVQVLTDSSLVAVGQHYEQHTWILEYVGGGPAAGLASGLVPHRPGPGLALGRVR